MSELTSFPLPDSGEILAEIVRAIPDDWSWVDGRLDPPTSLIESGKVARAAGYCLSRYSTQRLIIGPWNQKERRNDPPDLEEILIAGKLPTFISFDETGFQTKNPSLAFAKRLAAHFLLVGYRGWLDFSAGCYDEYKHENPAACSLTFERRDGSGPLRVNWRGEAKWERRYGGRPELIEPIHEACKRLRLIQEVSN